jgi:hypothetical protein
MATCVVTPLSALSVSARLKQLPIVELADIIRRRPTRNVRAQISCLNEQVYTTGAFFVVRANVALHVISLALYRHRKLFVSAVVAFYIQSFAYYYQLRRQLHLIFVTFLQ